VLYNGATVDFAIRVNSLAFRKVVRRKSKHLWRDRIQGMCTTYRLTGTLFQRASDSAHAATQRSCSGSAAVSK
jgi:hypothetical protein